ncbi:MAG: DsrE family protein [Gammaproteobacteria bacterium]|nr:DsrE family protein [Gammaproteobacteria bacterium]MCP5298456.1 DsrE family protein [Chromatiaceae bacterium]
MQPIDAARRRLFQLIGAAGGLLALGTARAHHTDTHFDDKSEHQIVYQCNKADNDYLEHILFSVGELIRKHGDNVEIVVACFGPGIHLLGDPPERPVAKELQERASSLSAYGVRFHACKNTMDSLGWTEQNLVSYAVVVPIGVEDMMLLQEKGFSYVSW